VLKHFLSFSKKEPVLRKKQRSPAEERGEEGQKQKREKGKAPIFLFFVYANTSEANRF